MRYPVDLHAAHLPKLLNTFLAVIGTDVWEKRARDIVTHLDQVPILRDLVFARHRIEIELARFVSRVGDARGAPVLVDNESEFELVAFMSAVVSVFERLSEKGKNRMRGMLRDGLQTDMGLLPLQHELTVATHLRSRGFNVVFQDMDGEGGADYIARRGVTEIEIECKMISGDIGRMIHRRKAVNLLWALLQSANHMPETNSKGIFVRVTVPGRLHGSDNERDAVINAVRTSVATPNQSAENEFCSISIEAIDLATAVFTAGTVETLTGDVLRDYVQERFGVGNVNVLSSVVLGRSILVACVESRQKDRVLESMLQTLKKSAKAQFGKTRARSRMVAPYEQGRFYSLPAVFAVQLHDITEDGLLELASGDSSDRETATGLQLMSTDFFNSECGANILALAFRAHGKLERAVSRTTNVETTSTTAGGSAYLFNNHLHPCAGDRAYNVFGR